MTITCTQCRQPKDITCFDKSSRAKSGYRSTCKQCRREKELPGKREYMRNRYANDPAFREEKKKIALDFYYTNREAKIVKAWKDSMWRRGISPEIYERMLTEQDNRCAICNRTANEVDGRRKRLCVDHDHSCCSDASSCGRCNRGLLCNSCNAALGYFEDSIERMEAAIAYLKKPRDPDSFIPPDRTRVITPQTRERMAAAQRGKKHSSETRGKMSESHKAYVFTPEHRANISAAKRGTSRKAGPVREPATA